MSLWLAQVADGPLLDWFPNVVLARSWAVPADRFAPGLPARDMPLRVLERTVIEEATFAERDLIWAGIVAWSRHPDASADYRTVALTIAAKGLRGFRNRLPVRNRDEVCDVDADLAFRLLRRLATINLDAPRIGGRLLDSAIGHAKGRWRLHLDRPRPGTVDLDHLPGRVAGSLNASFLALLVAAAAAGSLLDPIAVDLIARTRLDHQTMIQVAAELGLPLEAAYKRRQRAEARLRCLTRVHRRQAPVVSSHASPGSGATVADRAGAAAASGEVVARRTPAAPGRH